jgi:hypothetical protein
LLPEVGQLGWGLTDGFACVLVLRRARAEERAAFAGKPAGASPQKRSADFARDHACAEDERKLPASFPPEGRLATIAALLRMIRRMPQNGAIARHRHLNARSRGYEGRASNKSYPVGDDSHETDGGEEVCRELGIARGDAAEILQPAEVAFDHGAVRGGLSALPDARLAVGFSSDDGAFFVLFENRAERMGVVAS